MGAVYRATDTRLNRDIAIKVLPDVFAQEPDRLLRFTRESQVLASLNQYDSGAAHKLLGRLRNRVIDRHFGPCLVYGSPEPSFSAHAMNLRATCVPSVTPALLSMWK